MEQTAFIVDLVLRICSLMVTLVLAFLAIKRKVVTVKSDGDMSLADKILMIGEAVSDAVVSVEEEYKSLFKNGAKAGKFKLRDVLDVAKEGCENANIYYDKAYWTKYITTAVSVMNQKIQLTEQIKKVEEDQDEG